MTPDKESPPMTATLLADQIIGIDSLVLDGIDTSEKPLFSISEMGQFFFARSGHWVRWLEHCDHRIPNPKKPGKMMPCGLLPAQHTRTTAKTHRESWRLVFDGQLLEPIRTKANARKYDLALIEKIAHALASNGTITVAQLRQALLLVKTLAEMNGYLEETYARPVAADPKEDH